MIVLDPPFICWEVDAITIRITLEQDFDCKMRELFLKNRDFLFKKYLVISSDPSTHYALSTGPNCAGSER